MSNYSGIELPDDARYVARDEDGKLHSFPLKPYIAEYVFIENKNTGNAIVMRKEMLTSFGIPINAVLPKHLGFTDGIVVELSRYSIKDTSENYHKEHRIHNDVWTETNPEYGKEDELYKVLVNENVDPTVFESVTFEGGPMPLFNVVKTVTKNF